MNTLKKLCGSQKNASKNMPSPQLIASKDNEEGLKTYEAEDAPYRFASFNSDAKKCLEDLGFVVISSVLSADEIKDAKLLLWDFIESNCDMRERDVSTWTNTNFYKICGEVMSGMIWDMGAGQSEFQWFIRTHPNVVNAFVSAWGVESAQDLVCSMDGFCLFRPWHWSQKVKQAAEWKTDSGWYHVDQNPISKPNFECLQGYVSLLDQNERTGGTTIITDTHKDFKKVISKYCKKWDGDWVRIPDACEEILNEKRDRLLISVKAGDLVIWDSRLVHCSSPAVQHPDLPVGSKSEKNAKSEETDKTDKTDETDGIDGVGGARESGLDSEEMKENAMVVGEEKPDFLRIVSMVTYSPKSKVKSSKVYEKRVNAYMKQMATSHWPHEFKILAKPALGVGKWKDMKMKSLAELKEERHQLRASLIGYPEYMKYQEMIENGLAPDEDES